jgi:hypothetical protein
MTPRPAADRVVVRRARSARLSPSLALIRPAFLLLPRPALHPIASDQVPAAGISLMPPPPSASAVPPGPLSHALIAQAVGRSVDGADTLDLSRQHVGHVSDDAVYELANVGREGRGVRR